MRNPMYTQLGFKPQIAMQSPCVQHLSLSMVIYNGNKLIQDCKQSPPGNPAVKATLDPTSWLNI
eukprot:scaffold10285_cov258-Chaetoceros_neogracile.AAC.5